MCPSNDVPNSLPRVPLFCHNVVLDPVPMTYLSISLWAVCVFIYSFSFSTRPLKVLFP
ncbi:uncharacterized protein CYBJADRAFT_168048 [Cyberlindnera jadinii NRRL Y-1542]|uniref:Uncharacterized protein n=1 Tax=Cyberlindnera jadinii (strain ATCC 18201 / CBS 1600 / BCRC 20928 / JCM 3617 / NBRC 0987 / NRRL Y-1542) TaxID=983966 RepID=A0A1E4S0E3_CYBJN|nr:hypothetical protein CYBJADRAFT_168048 [Cyberlindnera jadinii NRRL Y-1542]ODV72969.1 hypothetical protein CYBJADRAFT_168048 [Cyberlindnera jadinii NRRL Y-1542]